ncbi:hypothetical protein AKJ09_09823 [Labilithrix luteola]|uniref:Uncharacterized protein n=1 Tax=Labilithrix luteola TaxID=1391654 RepID=A0A0K1QCK4_9BACT|nr:hypothetical protein AKJ09_09823 [Labilithrix luteola]
MDVPSPGAARDTKSIDAPQPRSLLLFGVGTRSKMPSAVTMNANGRGSRIRRWNSS